MTYAIIETGGKQLRVEPGRFYDIELLAAEADQTVTLETVLLVQHDGNVSIGQPYVDGATVEGTVMRHLRGRKVIVYKMKPKKKTRKKRGHRQEITRLMINSISFNGSVLTSKEAATDETQAATVTPVVEEPVVETATPEPTDAVITVDATPVVEEPVVETATPEPADAVITVDATPVVEEPVVETATPEPADIDATPVVEEPVVETATPETTPNPVDTVISEETESSSTPENPTETESQ